MLAAKVFSVCAFMCLCSFNNTIAGEFSADHSRCKSVVSTDPRLVRFFYFPNDGSPELVDKSSLTKLYNHYDELHPVDVKVTIGGFLSSFRDAGSSIMKIIETLQSDPHAQHIILNLDWSALNGHSQCNYTIPDYSTAARNTECIGKQRSIVEFLNEIVVHFGLTFKQVTLIGFSLGCHLAGSLADTIYDSRSLRVGRIEALDPAGPGYSGPNHISRKLTRTDATLVFTFNTDCKVFGLGEDVGHINVVVDDCGSPRGQPGCDISDVVTFVKDVENVIAACNHIAANDVYTFLLRKSFEGNNDDPVTFYEVARMRDVDSTRPRHFRIWKGSFDSFVGTNKSIVYRMEYRPPPRSPKTLYSWLKTSGFRALIDSLILADQTFSRITASKGQDCPKDSP